VLINKENVLEIPVEKERNFFKEKNNSSALGLCFIYNMALSWQFTNVACAVCK